ncbi:hypothetical protein [Wolbachia endosymbiont of Psylliodes chrysocephala]|nr:hypothetical protein [Wolbachia endosymbiont of Psylliodes chrysocephala]
MMSSKCVTLVHSIMAVLLSCHPSSLPLLSSQCPDTGIQLLFF